MTPKLFTYGSLLMKAHMASRCPGSVPLGSLVIKDWKLVFRTVADIEPSEGDVVYGALYEVTPEHIAELDRFEGVAEGLYRKVEFALSDGTVCFFYKMNRGGVSPPSRNYLDTILIGYDDWGHPREALRAPLEESFPPAKPDEGKALRKEKKQRKDRARQRRRRERRIIG